MISTFFSLSTPSSTVVGIAISGLVTLLVAAQLVDFQGSRISSMSKYFNVFSAPLMVFFVFVIILRLVMAFSA
jgi:hypothetical protein